MKLFSHHAKGFTLVETLIAISILLVSIVTPLVGVSQSLTAAFLSRDEVTAFYLAQDAIEYVRNTRDTNKLSGENWDKYLVECAGGCSVNTLDRRGLDPQGVSSAMSAAYRLKYDDSVGVYGLTHINIPESPFYRKVEMSAISPDEIKVVVTVSWKGSAGEKSFVAEEHLFNWQ